MKTSNQLLVALLALILLVIVGTSMILKAEYDKIDLEDPFYGYSKETVPPFKVVQLQGSYPGLVQLQPGDSFEIRVSKALQGIMQSRVQGDTLVLSYTYPETASKYTTGYTFHNKPGFYIIAPQLSAVYSQGITCKLTGWQVVDWTLKQGGNQSGMLLTQNTIDNLSATIKQGGFLQLSDDNHIQYAQVQVKDTSSFMTAYDVIDSVRISVDSTASVKLPGSLFRKLAPQ